MRAEIRIRAIEEGVEEVEILVEEGATKITIVIGVVAEAVAVGEEAGPRLEIIIIITIGIILILIADSTEITEGVVGR